MSRIYHSNNDNINAEDKYFTCDDDGDEDDDSGLVADAFDFLPDEATLDLDLDVKYVKLGDIPQLGKNENICKKDISLTDVDNNRNNDHMLDFTKYKVLPKIPSTKKIETVSGKLASLTKQKAREWRRKRILNTKLNSQNYTRSMSNDLDKLCENPKMVCHSNKKPGKIVKDPLLGGEKIGLNRGMYLYEIVKAFKVCTWDLLVLKHFTALWVGVREGWW